MAATKKTAYHSEMSAMGPVEITVIKERQKSKYKDKPDYITLRVDGSERLYNTENETCAEWFNGLAGQTFVAVFEGSREDAVITYVGEKGTAVEQPKTRQTAKPPQNRPPAASARPAAAAPSQPGNRPASAQRPTQAANTPTNGVRPMGQTVGMAINNACQFCIHKGESFDAKKVTEIASGILRIAAWLEKGNLAPKPAHVEASDNDGGTPK